MVGSGEAGGGPAERGGGGGGEDGAGKAAMPPPSMPPPAMLPPAPRVQVPAAGQQKGGDGKGEAAAEGGAGEVGGPTAGAAAAGASAGSEPGVYEKPAWSGAPDPKDFPYYFEVLKNGTIVDKIVCTSKEYVLIGRNADLCGLVLEHPSISRVHAAVQFKADGTAYVFDMSTHGTRVNKKTLKQRVYARLRVGDVVALGQSSRLIIFNGPEELIEDVGGGWQHKQKAPPPEPRKAAAAQMAPKDAGKVEKVTLGNRDVSWGFGDDAQEVDSGDEVGDAVGEARELKEAGKLSEKMEKALDKCEKHMGRIANLKDEMKKIRAKEDAGVELTGGQQAQIEKNESKVKEIEVVLLEAEEHLAELLRPGSSKKKEGGSGASGRGRGAAVDDDDSDDNDSFYNRAKARVAKSKEPPRTLETLRTDLAALQSEEKRLRERLVEISEADKAKGQGGGGGDAVDEYLIQMERANARRERASATKRLGEISREMPKIEQLISLVSPALPELGRAGRSEGAVVNTRALLGLLSGAKQAAKQPAMREQQQPPASSEAVGGGGVAGEGARQGGMGAASAAGGGSETGGEPAASAAAAAAAAASAASDLESETVSSAGGGEGGGMPAGLPTDQAAAAPPPAASAATTTTAASESVSPRMPPGGARPASPAGDPGGAGRGGGAAARETRVSSGGSEASPVGDAGSGRGRAVIGAMPPPSLPQAGSVDRSSGEGQRGQKRPLRPDGWGGNLPPVPDFVDENRGGLHRPGPAKKVKIAQEGPPAPPAGAGAGGGEEEEAEWRPPQGQTGDGKTSLNDKLGY